MTNKQDDQSSPKRSITLPPLQQTQSLLKVYTYYRLILSFVLLMLFLSDYSWKVAGQYDPTLYLFTSLSYTVFNMLTLIVLYKSEFLINSRNQFFNICVDIVAITLIVHASGGIDSGLSTLLAISVAVAGIFFVGPVATLVAAAATLALITQHLYLSFLDEKFAKNFLAVGLLGILYFTTSFVIQYLAHRIRTSQQIVERKTADAADLQALNDIIIQRMRTGILVINEHQQIRMLNQAAIKMLGLSLPNNTPANTQLPEQLQSRISQWHDSPQLRSKPFKVSTSSPSIQANFAHLRRSADRREDTLIFLEDASQAAQHAQHLKLASLGRLTASIAHEIRNPLGAVSHAAQLLQESEQMNNADIKLASIIQNHSKRMNQIIENVLQLSRRKPAAPEKLTLERWLKRFCEDFQATSPEKAVINITLTPSDIVIPFDPSQLTQVLTNLCENGLRYSKQQTGQPALTLRGAINHETGAPHLDIIDYGPGIPEDLKETVFEPFFTTETKGSGLGLYMCRELCEANQALLDYRNSDNGSCFRLSFSHPDRDISRHSDPADDEKTD